jgi:putative ABC transport system permease protein
MTWLQRLWQRSKLEDQPEKEMRFHLEQHSNKLIARGYDPEEARRQAKLALGGPEQVKEECRDARGTRWLEDLWQDFRYALHTLRHRPGFTAVAVITLALGIGASTAIFSAVNPILFEPLPYPQASRITMIWDRGPDGSRAYTTFGTYRELVERSRSFQAIASVKPCQPTMTGAADPERLDGQCVSASYFRALGVQPALGRDFDASDDRVRGPKVAILSYGLWQRRFASDGTLVGRQITLDDNLYTVIGVMPRAFENVLAPSAEVWTPLQYDATLPSEGREWGHHLRMVGRVRPGIGTEQVSRELDTIAHAPVTDFARRPWASLKFGLIVNSLQDDVTRAVKPMLLTVLGAVLLVLLIACVNVMNLLLARGAQRRGEFAMRAALGAGRMRMIRQLITESVLLASMGGVLGMVVAKIGVDALVALSPPELPRASAIGVDGSVFAFALGITALIGLVIGLIPAIAYRDDLHIGLRQGSRGTTPGHQTTRRALVAAEVALALVLLVSAGLLLRSLERLFAVAPGFNASHLLTMQVQTSGHRFDDDSINHRFFAQALEAVRQVPGVTAAGFTSQLPLSGYQFGVYGVRFESSARLNHEADESLFRYAVSPGYVEAMSVPLRRGRVLDAHDRAGAPVAVLINESLAKRKFPGQDPVGRRFHVGPDDSPRATIVGVVGDVYVKQTSLAVGQEDAFYMTAEQGWFADSAMSLAVRARGDVASLAPAIKKAIWSVDRDQPITNVATMDGLVAASAAERRFALIVFEAFALVALVLAATGIYGVISGSVTERMREIGVRSALGASRTDILALVVGQAMTLTALGVAIGLGGAVAASRALVTLLFGVSRLDPLTYLGVIALLGAVSAVAGWVPAWRAARVDPTITLRME